LIFMIGCLRNNCCAWKDMVLVSFHKDDKYDCYKCSPVYSRCNENNSLSVKEFRRQIVRTYLKKGLESRSKRGWPTKLISYRTSNVPDIRYDQKLHTIQKRDKQRRCQFENCKGKPRTYCENCQVTLCIGCFPKYHTRP
jgi:hypothetical protein